MSRRSDEPDVEIGAVVKAKKLRFKKVPKTKVEFDKKSEASLEGRRAAGRDRLREQAAEPSRQGRGE